MIEIRKVSAIGENPQAFDGDIELRLRIDGTDANLEITPFGEGKWMTIAFITPDGTLALVSSIPASLGLQLDSKGRIVVEE